MLEEVLHNIGQDRGGQVHGIMMVEKSASTVGIVGNMKFALREGVERDVTIHNRNTDSFLRILEWCLFSIQWDNRDIF